MIPSGLCGNTTLEDELRYLDWEFDGSKAPSPKNLERVGQLVMESVIGESSAIIGNRMIRFSVIHTQKGEPVTAPGIKGKMYVPRPCSDEDDLELVVTTRAGGDEHDFVIYSGKSFTELWAVWNSWLMGAGFLRDMDKVDEEAKKAKEAEETKDAEADS